MSNIYWAAVSGDEPIFSAYYNWNPKDVPGPGDNAILGAAAVGSQAAVQSFYDQTVASIQLWEPASLFIYPGTTFTATNGTGSGANAGVIEVDQGATFSVGGNISNTGTIWLDSGDTSATTLQLANSVTLSGGGVVDLFSGDNQVLGGTSATTLTNVDNVISGHGAIGSASLTLTNQADGVIETDEYGTPSLNTGTNTIGNAGIILATGISQVLGIWSPIDNTGGITASDYGQVTINGDVSGAGTLTLNETQGSSYGGGTISVETGLVSASQTVDFIDSPNSYTGNILQLGDPPDFNAVISGFSQHTANIMGVTVPVPDEIDLQQISPSKLQMQWLQNSGKTYQTLQITVPGGPINLNFAGPYTGQTIIAQSDGNGGTDLTLGPSAADLAAMAADAYINGPVAAVDGFTTGAADTGPDAASADVFSNGYEYVIAFRGTVPHADFTSAAKTLLADASWGLGTPDSYLTAEVDWAANLVAGLAGANVPIILTGHSLGGAIAQILGTAADLPTMAFDAPESGNIYSKFSALSAFSKINFDAAGSDDNIRMYGDQVSVVGSTGNPLPNSAIWTITNPTLVPAVNSAPLWETFLNSHSEKLMASLVAQGYPLTYGISGPKSGLAVAAGTPTGVIAAQSAKLLGSLFPLYDVATFAIDIKGVIQNQAIDPTAATSYALIGNAGSPLMASVTLPSFYGLDHYKIETLDDGVWSAAETVAPMAATSLPSGASGISIQAYDSSGNVLVMPDGFTFGVTFAATGSFSGTLYTQLDSDWGGGTGNWLSSAAWSTGATPDPTTDAVVSAAGVYTVSVTDAETALSVSLAASGATIADSGSLTVSETLSISAGTFDVAAGGILSAGGVDIAAGRTLTDDGTVEVAGDVANAGTIAVASAGTNTDLRVLAGGATFSGGGTVSLSGAKAVVTGVSGAATLTNVDDTIKGAGFIGAGKMTLVNEAAGIIDASVKGQLSVNTKGETLINAGVLESTLAGAFLVLNATTIADAGGTIAAAGGVVDLQNTEVIGGTLAGTRPINVDTGSSTLDGADAGAITLTAAVQVLAGTTLAAAGTISGAGSVTLFGGGRLVVGAGGLTLAGGGHLDTSPATTDTVVGATASAALTNVNDHISAAGQFGDGSMALVNEAAGVIVDAQAVTLTIDTGAATIANAGIIESDGKGGVVVDSAIANTGTLLAAAGTLSLDGMVAGSGIGKVNGGVLYAASASDFEEDVTFGAGGALKLGDSEAYTGTLAGFSGTGTTTLDLADIAYKSGTTKASYAGTATGGVLTVTSGNEVAQIHFSGDYLATIWTFSGDGDGTDVVDLANAPIAGLTVQPPRVSSAPGFVQATAAAGAEHMATNVLYCLHWRPASPMLATSLVSIA